MPGLEGQIFKTILVDPPWSYNNKATRNAAVKQYPTMSLEELAALDLVAHSAENSHLWLWATAPLLHDALHLMEAWSWSYKTNLVWAKPQMGMGNYLRVCHEHVLFGTRGHAPTKRNDARSVLFADRREHSAKPESFIDLVESLSDPPGLEMFARRRRLDLNGFSWTYWGDEA